LPDVIGGTIGNILGMQATLAFGPASERGAPVASAGQTGYFEPGRGPVATEYPENEIVVLGIPILSIFRDWLSDYWPAFTPASYRPTGSSIIARDYGWRPPQPGETVSSTFYNANSRQNIMRSIMNGTHPSSRGAGLITSRVRVGYPPVTTYISTAPSWLGSLKGAAMYHGERALIAVVSAYAGTGGASGPGATLAGATEFYSGMASHLLQPAFPDTDDLATQAARNRQREEWPIASLLNPSNADRRTVAAALIVMALGGRATLGARGPTALENAIVHGVAAERAVPNLTQRGTLTNLFSDDAVLLQGRARTLLQDDAGRYWLQGGGRQITPSGSYDFVTLPNGTVRVARTNPNSEFSTHLGLSGGGEVSYAGTIRFANGNTATRGSIRSWSNGSGHYQPPSWLSGNSKLPPNLFLPW
jgi:hypothetical protein